MTLDQHGTVEGEDPKDFIPVVEVEYYWIAERATWRRLLEAGVQAGKIKHMGRTLYGDVEYEEWGIRT